MSFNEARKIAKAIEEMRYSMDNMVTEMGNDAVNYFKKSFTDQGFTDSTFSPWKRRKDLDSSRGRGRKRYGTLIKDDNGKVMVDLRRWEKTVDVRSVKRRAILIKTGALRRSLVSNKLGNYKVVISSNLPYANRHNEGLKGMPKREFVGFSGRLNTKLINKFHKRVAKIFKK